GRHWVLRGISVQKLLGLNRGVPWPISAQTRISNPATIDFHPDHLNIIQSFRCYYQNKGARITIGKGSYFAPNVGIITANHDPQDLNSHMPAQEVVLGKACWIGMNSVILPRVVLGDGTMVGAASVMTKGFPIGNCIIAGSPARLVRR